MNENDIRTRLDNLNVAAICGAIEELFSTAKNKNQKRYKDAINNVAKMENLRFYDKVTSQMTQQYAEFHNWVKEQNIDDKNIETTLQLISYGLFWENTAVHRLLTSLVEIAAVGNYCESKLMETDHNTNSVLERLISHAKSGSLQISQVLETLYSNQIRNAVVHGQVYFFDKGITLMNHKPNSINTIPSIGIDIWNDLYLKTNCFIELLFRKRLNEHKSVNQ